MKPRFSAQTMARVERNVTSLLTERCTIEREAGTTGTMGEPLHDWEVVAEDIACRVIRAGTRNDSSYEEVAGQEALVERFRLICPAGTAFDVDDRVRMADDAVYQIVDVVDRLTDEAFVSAIMTRVRA